MENPKDYLEHGPECSEVSDPAEFGALLAQYQAKHPQRDQEVDADFSLGHSQATPRARGHRNVYARLAYQKFVVRVYDWWQDEKNDWICTPISFIAMLCYITVRGVVRAAECVVAIVLGLAGVSKSPQTDVSVERMGMALSALGGLTTFILAPGGVRVVLGVVPAIAGATALGLEVREYLERNPLE